MATPEQMIAGGQQRNPNPWIKEDCILDDTNQNHNGLPTDVNKSTVSETESSVFGMWTEEPLNNAISNHANKRVAQRMGKNQDTKR